MSNTLQDFSAVETTDQLAPSDTTAGAAVAVAIAGIPFGTEDGFMLMTETGVPFGTESFVPDLFLMDARGNLITDSSGNLLGIETS